MALDEELPGGSLPAKVDEAWAAFAGRLQAALPDIAAGTALELVLDPTAAGTGEAVYSVRLVRADDGTVTATAVGNSDLVSVHTLAWGCW